MIILDEAQIREQLRRHNQFSIIFDCLDDGDVYSMLQQTAGAHLVPGSIIIVSNIDRIRVYDFGNKGDRVRVALEKVKRNKKTRLPDKLKGWSLKHSCWIPEEVWCISLAGQLFSRFRGILETDILDGKKVLVIGIGSYGADVIALLTKSGVTHFILMDDDRLEPGNIMRHWAGVSSVGRHKTKAVKDMILDKNPFAKIITVEKRVEEQTKGLVEDLVAEAEVVVCVTDNDKSRLIVNQICVEQRKVCFYSGAYRRAYGGQIQRVRPYESPCYQCFLMSLPDDAEANEEVSNTRQAEALSYSDMIVPVEPGLANDIAPMTQMLSKLVIQELLKNEQTTLRSLDKDFTAPFYLWFNRREIDTEQQKWKPLEFNVDGLHIMRWYGAPLPRHEDCPVCGDFTGEFAKKHSLTVPKRD